MPFFLQSLKVPVLVPCCMVQVMVRSREILFARTLATILGAMRVLGSLFQQLV